MRPLRNQSWAWLDLSVSRSGSSLARFRQCGHRMCGTREASSLPMMVRWIGGPDSALVPACRSSSSALQPGETQMLRTGERDAGCQRVSVQPGPRPVLGNAPARGRS